MHHAKRRFAGLLVSVGILLATAPSLAAAPATVEFIFGTAYAVSADGGRRALEKGSDVQVGDLVVSDTARVQLRFSDGGLVSLAPQSEFRVNAYSYSGKPDGSERLHMELLKGGLRTISGLIGKALQSAYEMKTIVGTIGIRGTEYTVVYGESVSGTVHHGAIAVCNAWGCLDVASGQSYYIKDQKTAPVFAAKAALLPPPQPVHAANRQRNKDNASGGDDDSTKSSKTAGAGPGRGNEEANAREDSQRNSDKDRAGGLKYDFAAVTDDERASKQSLTMDDTKDSPQSPEAGLRRAASDSSLIVFPMPSALLSDANSPDEISGKNIGKSFGSTDALNLTGDNIIDDPVSGKSRRSIR